MITAVIVEDETKSREVLETLVKTNCPDVQVAGTADSVASGVELIRKINPKLVFLDIEMADGSGFDLLEQLPQAGFEIIFTTASDQHALRAIKYSAIDYLLKPIDGDELKAAVDKIVKKQSGNDNLENLKFLLQNFRMPSEQYTKITLPTGNAYEIVNVKDIIRCEADGSYTSFFLENKKKLLVSASLKHYEDLLPENDFIRVHHHHLININHVVRYLKTDGGYAVMTDGSQIEISRRKKEAFLQRLNKI
ncbi:MAG: LytTR family DNA-binding domain-containing protein [Bacteroidia bacterium]|jgi:two-component system LytT family response regulator|nr:LytTR family DNA-binding domain-containing protein [Bacteroidia bacterium]